MAKIVYSIEIKQMEEFKELTEIIRKIPPAQPPDDFTPRVMAAVMQAETGVYARTWNFLARRREFSSDVSGIISGMITSHQQYAYLLFFIGIFYLITGLSTLWGLHNVLKGADINLLLRMQPYFAVLSAVLLIFVGIFIIIYKQKAVLTARNIIIMHTVFISVNACILEWTLFLPAALIFTLILAAPAVLSGILLINSVQNYIKSSLLNEDGCDCV
jgi:hypothetical protein